MSALDIRPLGTLPPLASEPPIGMAQRLAIALALPLGTLLLAWSLANSQFQRGLNGDGLIPVLVGTMHYTPYFWRQDRYGMVLPYLLQPIHHPLHHLIALTTLEVALSLGAFFALAHFLLGRRGPWVCTALLALVLHLGFGTDHFIYETLGLAQFFMAPVTMALAALVIQERMRHPARLLCAVALMTLSGWYNFIMPVLAGLLVAARASFEAGGEREVHRLRPWWRARLAAPSLLCLQGFVSGNALRLLSGYNQVHLEQHQSMGDTWQSAKLIASDMVRELSLQSGRPRWAWALVGLVGLGLFLNLSFSTTRQGWLRAVRPLWVGTLAAIVYAMMAATQPWVRESEHNFRFFSPAAMVLLVTMCAWVVRPLVPQLSPPVRRALPLMLTVLVALGSLGRFGPPEPNLVRELVFERGGKLAQVAVDQQATHIAGDYWHVWPAVFAAHVLQAEGKSESKIFGYANRGEVLRQQWPPVEQWRVVVEHDQPNAAYFRANFEQMGLSALKDDAIMTLLGRAPIAPHKE